MLSRKVLSFLMALAVSKSYAAPPCNSSRPVALCAEWIRPYSDNAYWWENICEFNSSSNALIADNVEFYDGATGCNTPSLYTATCCAEFAGCADGVDCDGPETALPPAQTNPELPTGWTTAVACAVDDAARVLSDVIVTYYPGNTPYNCVTLCASKGYAFAGVEYSDECYCGTGYAGGVVPVSANVSDCDMRCSGGYYFNCGDSATFFGTPALPDPGVDPEVLTVESADDTTDQQNYELLTHMNFAMMPAEAEDSAIDDFTVVLLKNLGLYSPSSYSDVCIIDRSTNDIILLVQDHKRLGGQNDTYGQLVAEAVAAYQDINARRSASGLETLESKVMPGIIIIGTFPSFFKIPITKELAECVQRGMYPENPTVVLGHVPDIPRPHRKWSEGMIPLDNRRIILQCFEAFKQFVV
ncbi:hypothetical protein A0H81_03373 [Grifola frondosa]|uniref:WSC domain-containing protein n=1 Tax=Grifola frondosa TaxID=5627 RepID=A0A1C7MGX4_GRIFR|nr:hypothetical protein A0H81_03373 [Grifola frondosa]